MSAVIRRFKSAGRACHSSWNNQRCNTVEWACPRLRLVLVGLHAKKAVIIWGWDGEEPDAKVEGVRWVVRKWMENEEAVVRSGEHVYSLWGRLVISLLYQWTTMINFSTPCSPYWNYTDGLVTQNICPFNYCFPTLFILSFIPPMEIFSL